MGFNIILCYVKDRLGYLHETLSQNRNGNKTLKVWIKLLIGRDVQEGAWSIHVLWGHQHYQLCKSPLSFNGFFIVQVWRITSPIPRGWGVGLKILFNFVQVFWGPIQEVPRGLSAISQLTSIQKDEAIMLKISKISGAVCQKTRQIPDICISQYHICVLFFSSHINGLFFCSRKQNLYLNKTQTQNGGVLSQIRQLSRYTHGVLHEYKSFNKER